MNEIKDPCIKKAHEKSRLVIQAHNDNKNLALTQSLTLKPADNVNRDLYIRPPCTSISILCSSSDCIVKLMKLLHDVLEESITRFATYHPHYKDKRVGNPSRTLARVARPSPVSKNREPSRTSLHLLFQLL